MEVYMKCIGLLLLLLFEGLFSTLQAQNFDSQTRLKQFISDRGLASNRMIRHAVPLKNGTFHLPASATPDAVQVACPPDAIGAVCGYVKVPLDREHPKRGNIRIHFELYTHSNPGPAQSAILANIGGPGVSTTETRGFWLGVYGSNLDAHDLLLIDDRGRGLSEAIDCPELQHGTAPFAQAEGDCAAQLGLAASRYGTGDIAQDTEAVRAALGYDQVDYHGGSYGGADVTAYATRFGKHLRSIVLDAPLGAPSLDAFVFERDAAHSIPREVRLGCQRSPTCSPDHLNPDSELNALLAAVRAHPIEGDAHDGNGNLQHVTVDENAVLNFMLATPTGNFLSSNETLAAAASLFQGDAAPLLRLGAEGFHTVESDLGDPTFWSAGARNGARCSDVHQPWDWSSSVQVRQAQFAHAVSDLPSNAFAPFSKAAGTTLLFSSLHQCIWWEEPTPSSPVTPPGAVYPNAPTLVLDGDIDTSLPLEATRRVAALFPSSTFVRVTGAGHESSFFSQCARDLASRFIETLSAGDVSCANTPDTIFPAVGSFPLFTHQARPADVDPQGSNQVGIPERKVVTVTVATATDALQRIFVGSGDGAGLRAGTFHTDFTDTSWVVTLSGCSFAKDIVVNGTVTWAIAGDLSFLADLAVSGSGTNGGFLHVEGKWQAPGPVGRFKVSGALGGHTVALLVPEA
jgi:pimeloyl-ACP methyl ester carboxylesterase